jgi:hypothetical protein
MEKKFKEKEEKMKFENKKKIVSSHRNVVATKVIFDYVNIS